MTNPLLSALNEAGEALKATGEQTIVLSFHAAGRYFTQDRYGIRIELDGGPGVHGSGTTAAEAYEAALRQRDEDAARIEREARIRELGEAALVGEPQRRAA